MHARHTGYRTRGVYCRLVRAQAPCPFTRVQYPVPEFATPYPVVACARALPVLPFPLSDPIPSLDLEHSRLSPSLQPVPYIAHSGCCVGGAGLGWLEPSPLLCPTPTAAMPSVRASSPSSSSSASSHSILYINQLLPHHQQRGLQSHSHSHSTSGGPPGGRSTSSSSSTGRANSATTATPATATANATVRRTGTSNSGSVSIASSDDFEHLLSRQDTLKMSLTPNRVRHAGMVAPSTGRPSGDGNGSGNRYRDWEEEEEAEVAEREEEVRASTLCCASSH